MPLHSSSKHLHLASTMASRSLHLNPQSRLFTTTAPLSRKRRRILPLRNLPAAAPPPPPYPYEKLQKLYKTHLTGLYGGSIIQFGNNVSEQNEIKTRRTWEPNALHKRLYSLALGRFIRVKITTAVLRTVEKAGGIDEYLLGTKPQRLKELGDEGWRLRWMVLQTLKVNGDPRVFNDPVLSKEIELGDAAAAARGLPVGVPEEQATVVDVGGLPGQEVVDNSIPAEQSSVERTILRRLAEDRHMREEQDMRPPSVWQRIGDTIHAPIRWSNAAARRLFGRR